MFTSYELTDEYKIYVYKHLLIFVGRKIFAYFVY